MTTYTIVIYLLTLLSDALSDYSELCTVGKMGENWVTNIKYIFTFDWYQDLTAIV